MASGGVGAGSLRWEEGSTVAQGVRGNLDADWAVEGGPCATPLLLLFSLGSLGSGVNAPELLMSAVEGAVGVGGAAPMPVMMMVPEMVPVAWVDWPAARMRWPSRSVFWMIEMVSSSWHPAPSGCLCQSPHEAA